MIISFTVTAPVTISNQAYFPGDRVSLTDKFEEELTQLEKEGYLKIIKKHEDSKKTPLFPSDKFQLKDYEYFHNLKKDNRYLIDGFLYPGTLNAIWSPPEYFKSMVTTYLAVQLSTGKEFLGLKTKKKPVLIMDNENNDQIIKKRLTSIRKGEKTRSKKMPLYYITDGGALFDSSSGLNEVLTLIKEKDIKLVVIDTLHRFSDYEENKADDINRIYREILKPIIELDCSILYLHHTGKDGKYRGSIDLLGMVDSAFRISRPNRKAPQFSLICEKSRFGDVDKLNAEIDFGEDYIKIRKTEFNEQEKEQKSKFLETVNKIGAMFSIKEDTIRSGDIFSEFEILRQKDNWDVSDATIKKALQWLKAKDKLVQKKKGYYTRNWEGKFEL